jgi:hypothetical protein
MVSSVPAKEPPATERAAAGAGPAKKPPYVAWSAPPGRRDALDDEMDSARAMLEMIAKRRQKG